MHFRSLREEAAMLIRPFSARHAAVLLLGLAAACDSPSGPAADAPPPLQPPQGAAADRIDCTASPRLRTVACGGAPAAGTARSALLGGQGVNLRTVTANVAIVADTFAFDLRLVNLRPKPIGTLDGTTADPAGTKVFFSDSPPVSTTAGTGLVTVANPDGVGTFTATNQPYYTYVQALATNDTSGPKRWKLRFDPAVEQFSFHLLVQTATGFILHGVSANMYSTCGLDPADHVLCWGGWSTTVPTPVYHDSAAAQISGNCALTPGGHAFCFGSGGQTNLPGGLTFTSLSLGRGSACALDAQGTAYCWGGNNVGQLGNGTVASSSSPQPVSGGLTFTQISVGGFLVCGVAQGGSAYCWGDNRGGALGGPSSETCFEWPGLPITVSCSTTPVAVSGGVSFVSVTVSLFGNFACGLTAKGAAYCWGSSDSGQLGSNVSGNAASPVSVAGNHVFSQIDGGVQNTCGVEAGTGTVYCWGLAPDFYYGSTPVAIPGNVRFTSISIGSHGCGLATDGEYYCWGRGVEGELGNGGSSNSAWPVRVAGQF